MPDMTVSLGETLLIINLSWLAFAALRGGKVLRQILEKLEILCNERAQSNR